MTNLNMRTYWKRGSLALVTLISVVSGLLPSVSAASPIVFRDKTHATKVAKVSDKGMALPEKGSAKSNYIVDITAYTSTPEECDSDPFITADGSTVRNGIIAANFLPFGTKVRIPDVFGDRVFEVHDRMNKRYWYRIDIWMDDGTAMRQFGIKRNMKIEVVEMGNGKTQWAERARMARLVKQAKLAAQLKGSTK